MLDWRRNKRVRVKMMYSPEERVFLVSTYFLTNRNLNATHTEFGKQFNAHSRKLPAKSVIQRLVAKFEKTGSVLDDKRGNVGPKQSAHTPETVERAQQILKESPAKSVHLIAQEAGVSKSNLHRIVKEELHLYPYKMQMLQILTPFSKQRTLAFAENFHAYLAAILALFSIFGLVTKHIFGCPVT